MLLLGLNETINKFGMVNSVSLHGYVLRREDGHVRTRVMNFEVEGQMQKRRLKKTYKKLIEEESIKAVFSRECVFC